MSVYADTTAGDPTQDFYDISWCDGHLDQATNTTNINTSTGPYTAYQVLYQPDAISASSNIATNQRLFEMVDTSTGLHWDFPILVMPIDSSGGDGTNPFTGSDITGNGETWLDDGVTPNVVTIAYDINIANLNVVAYDNANNPITMPRNVLFYHELSHAYHYVTNTVGAVPPSGTCTAAQYASDEPQAETDENVLRQQLGLCLRNVCDHNFGTGTGNTCGGSSRPPCAGATPPGSTDGGGSSGGGCFIVSAASGSPHSAEVRRLQNIRRNIGEVSDLGGRVVNAILREYYLFSPEIAVNLDNDPEVRKAVMSTVVRPLVAWFTLASKLGFERACSKQVGQAVREILEVCPPSLGIHLAPFFEAIRNGGPLPANTPTELVERLPRVKEIGRHPFVSWAILDALVRVWTISVRGVDPREDVAEWLSNAPVDTLEPPSDAERLDAELAVVAKFFDFRPEARRAMGTRLAEAWPAATDSLKRRGFTE